MKKYTLILILAGIALLIVVVLLITSLFLKNEPPSPPIIPSPNQNRLAVVSTSIQDGQTNVSLDTKIEIKFNSKINSSLVSFNILPTPLYDFEIKENVLLITPRPGLLPSTIYSVSISSTLSKELLTSFSFTTFGPTPTLLPDTKPPGEPENTDELLRQTRPDVYLSNKLPHSEGGFSVNYEFVPEPTSHFAFTVTLSGNENEARSAFLSWLSSLELTNAQINSLDITYD